MATAINLAGVILTRLETMPGTTVLDSEVRTTPAGAYVVFYDETPAHWSNNLSGGLNRMGYEFRLVCVGKSPAQCRNTVRLAAGLLAGWRFDNSQQSSWLIEVPEGAPIIPDRSVPEDVRYSQTLHYRLTTSRS